MEKKNNYRYSFEIVSRNWAKKMMSNIKNSGLSLKITSDIYVSGSSYFFDIEGSLEDIKQWHEIWNNGPDDEQYYDFEESYLEEIT